MTIDELIERLEEYRDELGGDSEVRMMTQAHWLFENEVIGLASLAEIRSAAETEDEDDFDCEGDAETVLYIVEGQQLGYGTKAAWQVAR